MSSQEHYAAVLSDLEQEQAEVSNELDDLESQRQMLLDRQGELGYLIEGLKKRSTGRSESGPYEGLGIVEAATRFLNTRGRPEKTATIADAITAGGVASKASDPVATVYGVLHRDDKQGGEIAKSGKGTWGLRVWEPKDAPDCREAGLAAYRKEQQAREGAADM